MGQYGFYINMDECAACHCCQIACKDKNDLEVGFNFRTVTEYEGGTFPTMWAASLSLACNHCAVPACMGVCPVDAIVKSSENGLVVIDKEVCIGCQSCVGACPYHAPVFFPDDNVASKCDGCRSLLAEGGQPACVAACATRCLDFGNLDELKKKYADRELVSDLSVLVSSSMTGPSLLITPKKELAG